MLLSCPGYLTAEVVEGAPGVDQPIAWRRWSVSRLFDCSAFNERYFDESLSDRNGTRSMYAKKRERERV